VRVAVPISDLVERFYGELWNKWNDLAVEDMLAPGFAFRGSLGAGNRGAGWVAPVPGSGACWLGGLPQRDRRAGVGGAAGGGDGLRYTGTHTGVLLGLPAIQRRFEYAGAAFFAADSRLLTGAWVLGDLDGLGRQLR